jgi:DNA-binding transcriptional regulator YhcF (GntR family)
MASKYYIKLWHDILDDPKMGLLRADIWRRAIECFLMAGEMQEDGYLPSLPDMAFRLRTSPEMLEAELTDLAKTGIVNTQDGRWHVTNFAKRQKPMTGAERTERYRATKRGLNFTATAGQRTRDDTVTNRYTEEEKEIEEEKEKDLGPPHEKLPPLPVHLATPTMMNEWGEWVQYHIDSGKPLVFGTALLQFEDFEKWGPEHSAEVLRFSRKNNYTGLVQPKGNSKAPLPEPERVGGIY